MVIKEWNFDVQRYATETPFYLKYVFLQWKEGGSTRSSGMLVPDPWFHYLLSVARWSTFRRVTRSRYCFVCAVTLELSNFKAAILTS